MDGCVVWVDVCVCVCIMVWNMTAVFGFIVGQTSCGN